jgi:Fe-S-cluster containining protein
MVRKKEGRTKIVTCGGECCKRFILNYSPKELKKLIKSSWNTAIGFAEGASVPEDMFVYLGEFNWDPAEPERKYETKVHHYTCKYWDKETTLCTVYAKRPRICRLYPDNDRGDYCKHPGCRLPGNDKKRKEALKLAKRKTKPKFKSTTLSKD